VDWSGDAEPLRSALAAALPSYMVPGLFGSIAQIPLSANGKVDVSRLPALAPFETDSSLSSESQSEEEPEAPRNPAEERLRAAFAEAANVKASTICCVRTDFFGDLGGTSSQAVLCLALANKGAAERLRVPDLLAAPTVRALAARRASEASTGYEPLEMRRFSADKPARAPEATLVLINPAGATGLCYARLARALGPTVRVVALDDGVVAGRVATLAFGSVRRGVDINGSSARVEEYPRRSPRPARPRVVPRPPSRAPSSAAGASGAPWRWKPRAAPTARASFY